MSFRLSTPASVLALCLLSAPPAFAGPGAAGHGHSHDGATAYGRPGDQEKPNRVVEVAMREADGKMLFSPDRVELKRGQQIRFRLTNHGELEHEFVIATVEENRKHAEAMQKNPDMEHDDPNAKRLKPNEKGEILWRFTKAGTFEFACLIPGHLEAGMKGTIIVK